ncbi:hypothetical protein L6452_30863 [Arctium lappa]|uniref:Uncharacterized protein n=1 Tax=Arctium lappa TaxID=4217 RepID=A0ACB8ZK95_ARCLA|nr:hypothetical protein L6452_30863 [Arctium lappa]
MCKCRGQMHVKMHAETSWPQLMGINREEMACEEDELGPDEYCERLEMQHKLQQQGKEHSKNKPPRGKLGEILDDNIVHALDSNRVDAFDGPNSMEGLANKRTKRHNACGLESDTVRPSLVNKMGSTDEGLVNGADKADPRTDGPKFGEGNL